MMLTSQVPQKKTEIRPHAIPLLLLPLLFLFGVWGVGHYEVVGRGQGFLPTTFVPPSLLVGCTFISVLYGAFCLWLAKLYQKPTEFVPTFFLWVFAGAPIFIGFCALTFSVVVLSLNGLLDSSKPQSYQTTIQKCNLFVSSNSQGERCKYYVVRATDWNNSDSQVQLNVNPKLPNVAVGSKLIVTTRRGLFGYEWIVNIQRSNEA